MAKDTLKLADGGPIYFETNMDPHVLVKEPWNMASAAFFILIVLFWVYKIRGEYKKHLFITCSLPVLLVGGIGGTIYHGFRLSRYFLVMDWLPILLLTVAVSVYFFVKSMGKWWYGIFSVVLLFGLQFLSHAFLPITYAINIGYAIMGLMVVIPSILIMVKTKSYLWFVAALLSFGLALFFRIVDHEGLLPMGTHFLWHTFGGFACAFIIAYVRDVDRILTQKHAQESP